MAECCYAECCLRFVIYAECYKQALYAERRYAKRHYAECQGNSTYTEYIFDRHAVKKISQRASRIKVAAPKSHKSIFCHLMYFQGYI